jgi:hypothetical protein
MSLCLTWVCPDDGCLIDRRPDIRSGRLETQFGFIFGQKNRVGCLTRRGYHKYHPSYLPGVVPGLRVFDGNGLLLESIDDVNVTCVRWNAASTTLAYQVEGCLYLWDSAAGSTRLISDQLNEEECSFKWVRILADCEAATEFLHCHQLALEILGFIFKQHGRGAGVSQLANSKLGTSPPR